MTNVSKIFIFAASIIIVCLICAVGFKTANEGKSAVTAGIGQINSMDAKYSNIDKSVYDGCTILGSELINLIKKTIEKNEYLSIVVKTLESSRTDYNYAFDIETGKLTDTGTYKLETSKAQGAYINQGAQFMGTVYRDANDNIICIWFEQLK
jgi:hypothetical protein